MTSNEAALDDARIVRVGGIALIAGAIAFMAVFSYLAAAFHYPEVLDGKAADVLPALLATGDAGRAVWSIYALLPLMWIPAGVGAFHALRSRREGLMRVASAFASLSAFAMMLGLMRWPSLHWSLAQAWAADPGARPALEAVFQGANSYLGNFVGEFLGELSINLFFLLAGIAMLARGSAFPAWSGWLGMATAVAGLVGMFRNAYPAVAPVSALNNYLLPLWMVVFGVLLVRHARRLAAGG